MNDPVNPYAPPQANIIPAVPEVNQTLASPWRRLGASVLDSLISSVIMLPLMWFGGYFARTMERASHGGGSWSPEQLLWAPVGLLVMLALNWGHLGRGQTIGKGVLGLRIVRKNGTPVERSHIILKRLLPVQLIVMIPCVGAIFALVDALCIFRTQHNTLHDDIADTKVIDLNALPAA
ncbi:RDD family protein [Prosthecobacter sp.]|uniref:RDD family protein n=1 Tax=Prosthecobacter sp. TaxID=1965333 RepID=UPI003784BC21